MSETLLHTLADLRPWPLAALARHLKRSEAETRAQLAALQQSGAQIRYFQQGHGSLETFYLDFLRKDEPATDKQNPQ